MNVGRPAFGGTRAPVPAPPVPAPAFKTPVQGIVETAQARIAAIDALQAAYEDRSAERAVLMAVVAAALSTPPAPRTPAEPVGVRDLAEVVRSSQKPGK